jgi:hypothetical protein
MSAPSSSFSKLSLSQEMQATRRHTRSQSGGKGKSKEPLVSAAPEEDPESGSDNESDDDFWSGHVIALDHCRQHNERDARGSYYAFQIAYAEVERCSIRFKPTDDGAPKCSCEEEGSVVRFSKHHFPL